MSSSLRRLGGEFFWIGLGQGVASLGGIVGVRLLTGFMSPARYGELALALTIVVLSQQLILGPLSQALIRFFAPMQEANKLAVFFRATWVLLLQATGVVLALAVLTIIGLWAIGQVQWVWIVVLAFLLSLLSGYNSALDGIQNAARHRIVVAWHQSIGQWMRVAMAVFLIVVLGSSSAAALLGYTLGAALVLASQFAFLKKLLMKDIPQTGDKKDTRDCVRQMHRFAWPFAGWGLFTWAQMASDRWALQAFAATGVVGLFAALFQVGYNPIYLLTGLAVQLLYPILCSRAGDGSDKARLNHAYRLNHKLLAGSLGLTAVGAMVAFLFHKQIFWLLVAGQYRQVSWLLPFMVLASGLFAAGQIATLPFMIMGNTQCLLAPKIGTAAICVLLNFAGAYVFGLAGVVFSNVAFSLAFLIWVLILMRRQAGLRLSFGCWSPARAMGRTGSSAT
ncbi:MAG: lipopolysaccharide biosynthesis protein [Terriglobia bacterium]